MSFLHPREPIPTAAQARATLFERGLEEADFEAASLACWLILTHNRSLASAKTSAKRKYGVPLARIERLVKSVIPEQFFRDRVSAAAKQYSSGSSPENAARARDRSRQMKLAANHMKDL